jgi:hypothetical protein
MTAAYVLLEEGFRDMLDDPRIAFFLTPQPEHVREFEPLRLARPVR